MTDLSVTLFGDVAVARGDRAMSFPPGKALELLAYLLVHRDRSHAREAVAEILWPDLKAGAAKKYLRQALWRLNTALRDLPTDQQLVVADANRVKVSPDVDCWLDLEVFDRCHRDLRDLPGSALTHDQARDVEEALALYRGDLLTTWYQEWCEHERRRLGDARLAMTEQLMGYCEARAFHSRGIELGESLLRHDVARESTHRQLMRLHHAAGDRTAALRQYERCTTEVEKEFGVRPTSQTITLYEQIRDDGLVAPSLERPRLVVGGNVPTDVPTVSERRFAGDPTRSGTGGPALRLAESGTGDGGHSHRSPSSARPTSESARRTVAIVPSLSEQSGGLPLAAAPRAPEDDHRTPAGGDGDEPGYADSTAHLLAELGRLDLLLARQVRRLRRTLTARDDGLSALYIPDGEVDAILEGTSVDVGESEESGDGLDQTSAAIARRVARSLQDGVFLRLVALAGLFDLAPFDLDVVVACLAPEIDRRYERLYGYLHDDATRRLPTVELVLNLLCGDLPTKIALRSRFAPSAPLLRHRLVRLADDPAQPVHSLLGRSVRLDPRIVGFLLEDDEVADPLRPYVRLVRPDTDLDALHYPEEFHAALRGMIDHPDDDLVVYCRGGYGVGKRSVAEACCVRWGTPLLVVAVESFADRPADEFGLLVDLTEREARLRGATLYWENVDALLGEQARVRLAALLTASAAHHGPVFLSGDAPWEPSGTPAGMTFVRLEFPRPGQAERQRLWKAILDGAPTTGVDPAEISAKFRLTGGQIADAATTARNLARARSPEAPAVTQDDLYEACRRQSNRTLGALARQITPRYTWGDIVLPDDRTEQLREIADQVRHREQVYETWGFARKVATGRGLAALFAGPSGTGKTMAAEVLANELGLDLYTIDLSTVVSKYIGETEKNLSRVFAEAETSNAVLFFDEADAMFGKRSAVRDAHDRYANQEVSYLLQRMEQYEGIVILATNLRKNLDDAFVRRLHATIEFPVPGVEERRLIWQRIWPDGTPLADDVDADLLAERIDLPGGNLRNIALAAAFLAAANGGALTMAHLTQATRREYQKMGKLLLRADT